MGKVLLIGLGAFFGANARYWLGHLVQLKTGPEFPYGTLCVNVLGSLLIGGLVASGNRWGLTDELRLLLIVGVLGGFTTFSSFSLETLTMLRHGAVGPAMAYVLATNAICLVACWAGFAGVSLMFKT